MAASLREIASRAAVPAQTVSDVLNGRGDRYGPEVSRRVFDAVESMGGHGPVVDARLTVALITLGDSRLAPEAHDLLDGLAGSLHEWGARLVLETWDDLEPRRLRDRLGALGCQGVLIHHQERVDPAVDAVFEDPAAPPSIWIGRRRDRNAVFFDDHRAGRLTTQHLLALGYRRIAWVDFVPARTHLAAAACELRRRGYVDAMRSAGSEPRTIVEPLHADERFAAARQWLRQPECPDAVLCPQLELVHPVIYAALQMGLHLPRQLAVAGFAGAYDPDALPFEPVCTVLPAARLGRTAAGLIQQRIDARGGDLPAVSIVPHPPQGGVVAEAVDG